MRFVVALVALFGLSVAQADEGQISTQLEAPSVNLPSGVVPYLGLGAGYTNYHRDADVEGLPSSLKLLGSYYVPSQKFVFDLGAGLSNQRFSQTAAPERNVNGAMLEGAARYQWPNRWQAGLNVMSLMDQGSSYGANQGDVHFAGLQALKELSLGERWIARAGARVMADLNVDARTVTMAMLDLQIGWNPAPRSQSTQAAPQATAVKNPSSASKPERNGIAKFEINSDELRAADRTELKNIAKKLRQLPKGQLTSIEVVGHADSTGPATRNLRLSETRALTVKEVFAQEGVNIPVRAIGKGSSEAAGENHDEQRRVDLRFNGVKDEAVLKELLNL